MDFFCLELGNLIFNTKNKNKNLRATIPFNIILGLYILPDNPNLGIASFETSLTMLHKTIGTTQGTSNPQPLLYKE